MRKRLLLPLALVAIVGGLMVLPVAAAGSEPPEVQTISVTAVVQDQVCLSGDLVQVTLTAVVDSTVEPFGFIWDTDGNGTRDAGPSQDPTVVATYGDEVTVTARVGAMNIDREKAFDSITFQTIRCTG